MVWRPFQVILLVFVVLAGCFGEATDEAGVIVPNMDGTYDRLSVSTFCDDLGIFDRVTEILQTKDTFILRAQSAGFEDYTGSVDSDAAVTMTGAGTTCLGTFIDGVLANTCDVVVEQCSIDPDTGEEVCEDDTFSCSVSYERR